MNPEWISKIIKALNTILPRDFIGKIEANCVKGHVGNLNVNQSYKDEKDNNENIHRR